MEEKYFRYQSQDTACLLLDQLLAKTYQTVTRHQIQQKVTKGLPKKYLSYMRNIQQTVDSHCEPKGPEKIAKKLMTQPSESQSYMRRPYFEKNRSSEPKEDGCSIHRNSNQKNKRYINRNSSLRYSIISRKSQQAKSKKYLSSRKLIGTETRSRKMIKYEPPKLIPLKLEDNDQRENDEKIDQLRKKKIKLEEAFKFFLNVQTISLFKGDRKMKENKSNMFTTDYKGKIINFCQKSSRGKEQLTFPVRIQTIIDSPKPWGKINLTATARKGFKQACSDATNNML